MPVQRPLPSEYNPYFQGYLDLVPDGSFALLFPEYTLSFADVFSKVSPANESFAYAYGKWNIKQLVQHVIDTDRVFSYRALVAARGDNKTMLHSMDENLYAANANVANRSLPEMLEEMKAVRASFYKLIIHLDERESRLIAFADNHPLSARAMAFISIGHLIHHMNVFHSRYSAALNP
jgi:hypothetical protein